MQTLRDDPVCAAEEHELRVDSRNPGYRPKLTFDLKTT